jgi:hypothetical protein
VKIVEIRLKNPKNTQKSQKYSKIPKILKNSKNLINSPHMPSICQQSPIEATKNNFSSSCEKTPSLNTSTQENKAQKSPKTSPIMDRE